MYKKWIIYLAAYVSLLFCFIKVFAYDFLETKDRVFWSQIGLENEEAETILRQSNRQDIVMNRCTKIEYMRLFV